MGYDMNDFNLFLEHVMKNFSESYPYGLSKTEVVRLSFAAWCQVEAQAIKNLPSPTEELAA
jgi:hypothetical protein